MIERQNIETDYCPKCRVYASIAASQARQSNEGLRCHSKELANRSPMNPYDSHDERGRGRSGNGNDLDQPTADRAAQLRGNRRRRRLSRQRSSRRVPEPSAPARATPPCEGERLARGSGHVMSRHDGGDRRTGCLCWNRRGDAIREVDAASDRYCSYFMINCVHPDHYSLAIDDTNGRDG